MADLGLREKTRSRNYNFVGIARANQIHNELAIAYGQPGASVAHQALPPRYEKLRALLFTASGRPASPFSSSGDTRGDRAPKK